VTYVTDAELGQLLADLDQLIDPAPETVRAIALELRQKRRQLNQITDEHNRLGVAAAKAEGILHAAIKEAVK
jgi:hypothetical protein